MINPSRQWAYGRLTKEIKNKLNNKLKDFIIEIKNNRDLDHRDLDLCEYIIEVHKDDKFFGEININNTSGIKIKFNKKLENIADDLEKQYNEETIKEKINKYVTEDYLQLIQRRDNALAKLPKGNKITEYNELNEFKDAFWSIRGQTNLDIWMTYYYLKNSFNYNWISVMTGLNENQLIEIKNKIISSIGHKLVEEIEKIENIRLNPFAD